MGIASNLFYSSDTSKETLHRRITPTDEQFKNQQSRWNELAKHIIPYLKDKSECTVKTWLQGSYKFDTQIRPIRTGDEFDIDLGFYFAWEKGEERYSYDEVRDFVYHELLKYADENEDVKGDVEMKERCCRISYNGGFHIDTPTYFLDENNDERLLASKDGWEDSDPKAIYSWFKDLFEDSQRVIVRRQIRYLKAWAAIHIEDGKRPSSIMLTVLAAEAAKQDSISSNDGDDTSLKKIVESIQERLRSDGAVINPANSEEDINRLSDEDMNGFIYELDGLVDVATRAEVADTEIEAADIWDEAFQHFFPFPEVGEEGVQESAGLPSNILPEIRVTATSRSNTQAKPFEGMNQIGPIPNKCDIVFEIINEDQLPSGVSIRWMVRNVGAAAENVNDLGHYAGEGYRASEYSAYKGRHYMDCMVRRYGRFLTMRRVPVTISNSIVPARNPAARPSYVNLRGRK